LQDNRNFLPIPKFSNKLSSTKISACWIA